jgi:hypothetical protein
MTDTVGGRNGTDPWEEDATMMPTDGQEVSEGEQKGEHDGKDTAGQASWKRKDDKKEGRATGEGSPPKKPRKVGVKSGGIDESNILPEGASRGVSRSRSRSPSSLPDIGGKDADAAGPHHARSGNVVRPPNRGGGGAQ